MRPIFRKTLIASTLAISLWTACASAQTAEKDPDQEAQIQYQLILPEEKTPESVKPNEPNPFNKEARLEDDQSSSEENSVREVLMSLPVNGISVDPRGGKRVMLGPMRLERGMLVPDVFAQQGVHLRVNSVSDTALELVWVEKKNTGLPPRTLIIPFNVRPRVKTLLPSAGARPVAASSGPERFGSFDPSRQLQVGGAPPPAPNTTSSADGTPPPSGPSATPPSPPAPNDPNHPANMLMNLLLNKTQPAEQPQKSDQPKD